MRTDLDFSFFLGRVRLLINDCHGSALTVGFFMAEKGSFFYQSARLIGAASICANLSSIPAVLLTTSLSNPPPWHSVLGGLLPVSSSAAVESMYIFTALGLGCGLYSLLLSVVKKHGGSTSTIGHNNDALALWTILGGIVTAGLFWGLSALGESGCLSPVITLALFPAAGAIASVFSVTDLKKFSTSRVS